MPSSASAFMTLSTSPIVSGSSAEVGSSNSISAGSMASARAIATRCCWPPDSADGMDVGLLRQPHLGEQRRRARSLPPPGLEPEHGRRPDGDVLQRRSDAGTARNSETPCPCAAAHARCPRLGAAHHRPTLEQHAPVIEGLERIGAAQQRRLAGARRPDQADDLAAVDRRDRRPSSATIVAVALRDDFEGEDRLRPFIRPP